MGIKGLWDLLKPVGQPINLEILRGKVLAIDISFWLHHAKYVSERKGISEHRAAIELVYRRILKLLHFGIRPIFVFDGPESSILKLPTLNERKKQREHQTEEKAKRSQNRALKNLARKALAVQLARDEGRKKDKNNPSTSRDDGNGQPVVDELDDATLLAALDEAEAVYLKSDEEASRSQDSDDVITVLPTLMSQSNEGSGEMSQKSVDIVFTGADHAHVLIRSAPEAAGDDNGDRSEFCDDPERRKGAVDRIRRLATLEHLKDFRHHQQKRCDLLASQLLIFEDEKRLQSSSDEGEFEEVSDGKSLRTARQIPKKRAPSPVNHSNRKRRSPSPTADKNVEDVIEPKKYTVEKWGARREENTEQKEASYGGGETAERCRELLTYFGIPYVDSPAEAEAQCVYLELSGFTDGTITDDSDAWAFGGRVVFRHVFERNKSAQEYRADSILETFGLEQLHFVALASVLGCDFTSGILNVGIVSALEIMSIFIDRQNGDRRLDQAQLLEKLAEFRTWWEQNHEEEGKADKPEKNAIKRRLRRLNCIFPPSFPDKRVFEIFTKPKVNEISNHDPNKPAFTWSSPDMANLRRLLSEELSDMRQVDMELADLRRRLVPPDPSQAKITSFYHSDKHRPSASEVFEASSSKRLKNACEKLKKKKT